VHRAQKGSNPNTILFFYHASICRICAGQMGQVSLPWQYHSTIIPYLFSIHFSLTLYAHRENAYLILTLPSSLLLYSSTDVTSWKRVSHPSLCCNFLMFLISGLCPKVAVNCALQCYCTVSSSNFLLAFQDNRSVPS